MVNAKEKEITEKEFEEELNESYDKVNICGLEYCAGSALKEVDPIAFNCGMADRDSIFICGKCEAEYEIKEEAEECCQIN